MTRLVASDSTTPRTSPPTTAPLIFPMPPRTAAVNALSPARPIKVIPDPLTKVATVIVPTSQLSLAIGREGQNARLAAKVTGWKVDIKSEAQMEETGEYGFASAEKVDF